MIYIYKDLSSSILAISSDCFQSPDSFCNEKNPHQRTHRMSYRKQVSSVRAHDVCAFGIFAIWPAVRHEEHYAQWKSDSDMRLKCSVPSHQGEFEIVMLFFWQTSSAFGRMVKVWIRTLRWSCFQEISSANINWNTYCVSDKLREFPPLKYFETIGACK